MYKLNSRSQESTHYLHSSYLVNLFSEYCPIHVVEFMRISELITHLISNFRTLEQRRIAEMPLGFQIRVSKQLTLFQPGGADYAQQIILAPPDFHSFLRPCHCQSTLHSLLHMDVILLSIHLLRFPPF